MPEPEPQPCVLEEADGTGTTHTVQTCGTPEDKAVRLGPDEEPEVGVGYYVDVDVVVHCNWVSVELGGRWWWADGIPTDEISQWAQPTEGGILTLLDEGHAEFVGDAGARTKVANLVPFEVQGERRPAALRLTGFATPEVPR